MVFHSLYNIGHGEYFLVCEIVHIKDPLLHIENMQQEFSKTMSYKATKY